MRENNHKLIDGYSNQNNPEAKAAGGSEIRENKFEQGERLEGDVKKGVSQWADSWLE